MCLEAIIKKFSLSNSLVLWLSVTSTAGKLLWCLRCFFCDNLKQLTLTQLGETSCITVFLEILTKSADKIQCESSHCTCVKPNSKSRIWRNNKAFLCNKRDWRSIFPACVFSSASFVALTMMFFMFSHQLHKAPLGTDDLETEILSTSFKAIFSWVLVVSVYSLVYIQSRCKCVLLSPCAWVY